jgi:hypothetical protein
VSITFRWHLAAAYLPAMVVVSLSQLMSASPLYDQKDLSLDATSDVLGMAVDIDPNLSIPRKPSPVQPTGFEATSFSRSDDESDFTDALSSPLAPGHGGSSASKDAVYSGLASNSVGSSSDIYSAYAAHDAGGIAAKVARPNLVAGFPAFDLQSPSSGRALGRAVDGFDSSYNSDNSNDPVTTAGNWGAPWRALVLPSSGFGSFADLLADNFGNEESRNGGNYGYDPGPNAYLGTLVGDTGGNGGAGISADPLDLTADTKGQKDGLLSAITSAAEPKGAGIAVVALILIFIALNRRSNRRARAARPVVRPAEMARLL